MKKLFYSFPLILLLLLAFGHSQALALTGTCPANHLETSHSLSADVNLTHDFSVNAWVDTPSRSHHGETGHEILFEPSEREEEEESKKQIISHDFPPVCACMAMYINWLKSQWYIEPNDATDLSDSYFISNHTPEYPQVAFQVFRL